MGDEEIDRTLWGELESESESSEEEEEEEAGEDDLAGKLLRKLNFKVSNKIILEGAPTDETGLATPAGLETPSGLSSVPAGMETPDSIELRKKRIEAEMEDNETPVLYHVLPEKKSDRIGGSMMASTHVYDIATAQQQQARRAVVVDREGMVELALNPDELDMDNEAMAQRYEQQMREQQSHLQKEDLSDMLHEHVMKTSKRKRQTTGSQKPKEDYKKFKF